MSKKLATVLPPVIVSQTCPACYRDGERPNCAVCNGTNLIHYNLVQKVRNDK